MYLEKINSPADVKKLNSEEMKKLAEEMRTALIKKLSVHGGHCGPNLGMVEAVIALHYVFVVADGRTDASDGLTIPELAEVMACLGAQTAYNLDGGGSSCMVFDGEVVNHPTTTGNRTKEREVSGIVYIGF